MTQQQPTATSTKTEQAVKSLYRRVSDFVRKGGYGKVVLELDVEAGEVVRSRVGDTESIK